MKYTFNDEQGIQKTVVIPDEYIYAARRNGMSNKEAIDSYLAEQGLKENHPATKKELPTPSRKRKEDPTKRELIASLFDFLSMYTKASAAQVVNPERVIRFTLGNDTFELTLSKKRK